MKKFHRGAFGILVLCAGLLQTACHPFGIGASSDKGSDSSAAAQGSLPNLCVSNYDDSSVAVFGKTQSGDAEPVRLIRGGSSLLTFPGQLSFDPVSSRLLVPNYSSQQLLVFSGSAAGDVAPIVNLALPKGRLVSTAVDSVNRELYLMFQAYEADFGGIEVYDLDAILNASNNQLPNALRIIAGDQVVMTSPNQLVVDLEHDELITGSYSGSSGVVVFPRTANGNVAPSRQITGPTTRLMNVSGVFYDSTNEEILVADRSGGIRIFSRVANGDVAPLRVIEGGNTLISTEPGQLLVDPETNLIHLVDYDHSAIYSYLRTDDGDVAPQKIISGMNTRISGPWGLTLCQ
ncbi:hypothetical protein EBZ37_07160 [bacterium]|nr:hypothetical protein [bacterium]